MLMHTDIHNIPNLGSDSAIFPLKGVWQTRPGICCVFIFSKNKLANSKD